MLWELMSKGEAHLSSNPTAGGESEVAQLYLTLCDPMDCSLAGSSIHGIFQARILEWVHFPLQGIFPTQESNPSLLHCRQTLLFDPLGNPIADGSPL